MHIDLDTMWKSLFPFDIFLKCAEILYHFWNIFFWKLRSFL